MGRRPDRGRGPRRSTGSTVAVLALALAACLVAATGVAGGASADPEQSTATVTDAVVARTILAPLPEEPYHDPDGDTAPTHVTDVAGGPGGWVAIGQDSREAVAWTSADGGAVVVVDRPAAGGLP